VRKIEDSIARGGGTNRKDRSRQFFGNRRALSLSEARSPAVGRGPRTNGSGGTNHSKGLRQAPRWAFALDCGAGRRREGVDDRTPTIHERRRTHSSGRNDRGHLPNTMYRVKLTMAMRFSPTRRDRCAGISSGSRSATAWSGDVALRPDQGADHPPIGRDACRRAD